jgi:macrodomain Ter protein organizer (MatP/YcbG family)
MSADKTKVDRKKVALNEDTYQKLKTYSRANGVKLRIVIDAMIDQVLADETLSDQIVAASLQRQADNA